MGFNNFVKIFLPKDKIFYSIFEEIGIHLVEMGEKFKEAINESDSETRKKLLRGIKDYENKNDHLTHQVFIELGQNFITPFDREDIHTLAIALDDVADYMYACSNKMLVYDVAEQDEFMEKMIEVILNAIKALCKGLHELRNMKNLENIREAIIAINSYENQADDLLDKGLKKLFAEEKDAIQLIKIKEIYQDMETITDKCEDAADIIDSIVIKYS